jgi:hypothetical protein
MGKLTTLYYQVVRQIGKKSGILSRRDFPDLSRRDSRTQPGVSTPGIDKMNAPPCLSAVVTRDKGRRRKGAVDRDFAASNVEPGLKRLICRPFRADSSAGLSWG